MSIFWTFFKTSLFRSKKDFFVSKILNNVLFSLSLIKTIIWENRRFYDKNIGLTPLQNAFFSIQNIKTCFVLALFAQIKDMKKKSFFYKNHGLTPFQNFDFWTFFKTSLFRSKKHFFLSRISKNVFFRRSLVKTNIWEKRRVFDKNHGVTPLQNVDFLTETMD